MTTGYQDDGNRYVCSLALDSTVEEELVESLEEISILTMGETPRARASEENPTVLAAITSDEVSTASAASAASAAAAASEEAIHSFSCNLCAIKQPGLDHYFCSCGRYSQGKRGESSYRKQVRRSEGKRTYQVCVHDQERMQKIPSYRIAFRRGGRYPPNDLLTTSLMAF
ncbi:hypothetical protein BX616_007500 [Lobosporangium transversale]|nr:hypothetical protein BX616_007500 [Lobosporangium transversale]